MFVARPAARIVRRSSDTRDASARCVGPGALETRGQTRVMESRGKVQSQGLGLLFGGETNNEYVLRGMVWADNYWLFCGNKEGLVCMVNDIIDELLAQDMEPKPESPWLLRT